ncbi:MAG TPA: squalene cyclase [Acidothermaceae bacterium]|nr:squalene cyclase [Acidothermaceae bacterium]
MTVIDWLLDSDPAIRWQVMLDLTDAPAQIVAAERARIATQGWGARLLELEDEDGQWDGGALFPGPIDESEGPAQFGEGQPWSATAYSLMLLRDFGIDPQGERVRRSVALVKENCRWEYAGEPFFEGEVEPCINGMVLVLGAYFEQDVDGVAARLLGEQLEDGGWNCEAERGSVRSSFHTTIRVLEGLLTHERATGGLPGSVEARRRGEEYFLQRKLFRRLSTGEVVDPDWLDFSFPTRWHYDVLRGLEYFRDVGGPPDPRLDEAMDVLRSKQQPDGTWLLENTHPGKVWFALEDGDGRPSRWNTLRALRVLRWYDQLNST